MKPGGLSRLRLLALALLACAAPGAAGAWPEKPYPVKFIRLLVPFTPASVPDAVARCTAQKLGERLGQQLILEHQAQADGSAATGAAVAAPADGYTLLLGSNRTIAINPHLQRLAYDPLRDLVPLAMLARIPQVLVANPAVVPARTLEELARFGRANPGKLTYTAERDGSMAQLTMEALGRELNLHLRYVRRDSTIAPLDHMIQARIALMWTTPDRVALHLGSNSLRALAVSGSHRAAKLPQVPTVSESRSRHFGGDIWFGLFAPRGTPEQVVRHLYTEFLRASQEPPRSLLLRACLAKSGAELNVMYREQFAALVAEESKLWGEVADRLGLRPAARRS